MVGCAINDDKIKFSLEVKNEKVDRMALHEVVGKKHIFIDSIFRKRWINGRKIIINKAGTYFLTIDKRSGVPLYLEPGFDVKIVLNEVNKFSYKGRGSDENEYLVRDKHHLVNYQNFEPFKLKPLKFAQRVKKIFNPYFELIEKNRQNKIFWKVAYADQVLKKMTVLIEYPKLHEQITKKEVKLPGNYWDFLDQYNPNSTDLYIGDKLIIERFFTVYTEFLLEKKIQDLKVLSNSNQILAYFQLINESFTSAIVRDMALSWFAEKAINNYSKEEITEGMAFYFKHCNDNKAKEYFKTK